MLPSLFAMRNSWNQKSKIMFHARPKYSVLSTGFLIAMSFVFGGTANCVGQDSKKQPLTEKQREEINRYTNAAYDYRRGITYHLGENVSVSSPKPKRPQCMLGRERNEIPYNKHFAAANEEKYKVKIADKTGSLDVALEQIDLAIAANKDSLQARELRGDILKDMSRYDEALATYKELFDHNWSNYTKVLECHDEMDRAQDNEEVLVETRRRLIDAMAREEFKNKNMIVLLGPQIDKLADHFSDLTPLIEAYSKAIQKSRLNADLRNGNYRSINRGGVSLHGEAASKYFLAELYAKQSIHAGEAGDADDRFALLKKSMEASKVSTTARTELTEIGFGDSEYAGRAKELFDPYQFEIRQLPEPLRLILVEKSMAEQNYDLAIEQLEQLNLQYAADRRLFSINTEAHLKSKNGDAAKALAAVDDLFQRRARSNGSAIDAEKKLSPVELYLMRIKLLMRLKRYGEATDNCARVLAEKPDHAIAMKWHIECYEHLSLSLIHI